MNFVDDGSVTNERVHIYIYILRPKSIFLKINFNLSFAKASGYLRQTNFVNS